MSPIVRIQNSRIQEQRAALVLKGCVEGMSPVADSGYIERPSRQDGTVLQRKCKNAMLLRRSIVRRDHGVHVNDAAVRIDDGSAGDAEWIDVAAGKLRQRDRASQMGHPDP